MKHTLNSKILAAAAVGLALPITAGVSVAQGWTAHDYQRLVVDGSDRFGNFDLTNRTSPANHSNPSNADWAVDYIFWNNAEIDKVKDVLTGFNSDAGLMNAEQQDGSYVAWDEDRGKKNPHGSCGGGDGPSDYHMRFYADPTDDRMYSPSWGYWIFASSHKDLNEGCYNESFGYGETSAEPGFVYVFASTYSNTCSDCINLYNPKNYTEGGNHVWDNDGLASASYVP